MENGGDIALSLAAPDRALDWGGSPPALLGNWAGWRGSLSPEADPHPQAEGMEVNWTITETLEQWGSLREGAKGQTRLQTELSGALSPHFPNTL